MIHRWFYVLFVFSLIVLMMLVGGLNPPKQKITHKNIEVFTNSSNVAGGTVTIEINY